MNQDEDNPTPWEPQPIPAEEFHKPDEWANINRAPHDQVSGVTYKRAMNIKGVLYAPLHAAPDMVDVWRGHGSAIVRWLFSEQAGTEEHLLEGATFAFLHDTTLAPGAVSGQRAYPDIGHILYVIAGQGILYHHPNAGSPVLARPLRPGDAALIQNGEYFNVANETTEALRLIIVGLKQQRKPSCPNES